ncbi:MAG: hypothetical protein J6T64_02705, partial [Bacteroidaceae bacterium]|nr:hypothetical protein [Bacteroidaceae bacterium]
MKVRLLLFTALGLMVSASVSAQSAAEISAAKSMARSYGYTDSEINAVLNHNIKQTSPSGGKALAAP